MKICLITLGCPKNDIDSELVAALLMGHGHCMVEDPQEADAAVVNTCGFIQPAVEESLSVILELAQLRAQGTLKRLVVSGCLVQRHPEALLTDIPEIDTLLGSSDHGLTLAAVEGTLEGRGHITANPVTIIEEDRDLVAARVPSTPASAYVRLGEGCSRRCAYCIIPALRGKARSREAADIVTEVRGLVARGVREIVLVAQDTTAYGRDRRDGGDLVTLLEDLLKIPGRFWLRIMYGHPAGVNERFLSFFAEAAGEKLLPYLDMPIQHVDERVLRLMNRGHGEKRVRQTVEKLKARVPGMVLRTTVLVGHPGETSEGFARLRAFVEEGWFEHLGAFPFYPEEGSKAATLRPRPRFSTAVKRADEVMLAQQEVSRKALLSLVGKRLPLLVEGPSPEHDLLTQARWAGQAPGIDGVVYLTDAPFVPQPGQWVQGVVKRAHDHDLEAVVRR